MKLLARVAAWGRRRLRACLVARTGPHRATLMHHFLSDACRVCLAGRYGHMPSVLGLQRCGRARSRGLTLPSPRYGAVPAHPLAHSTCSSTRPLARLTCSRTRQLIHSRHQQDTELACSCARGWLCPWVSQLSSVAADKQMWLMAIISTLCVCGGYALGYTHGCSWDLPQVPGDMCLVNAKQTRHINRARAKNT